MESDGEILPPSLEDNVTPPYDRTRLHDPRSLAIPVEISGRAVRVNISVDENLLLRIDDVAKRTGLSRLSLLARGARLVIARETTP